MKRLTLTALAVVLSATAADAGPIRRLFSRPACPTPQPRAVQYQPAPVVAMPQIGPVGPVRQAVGTVLVSTGGLIQQAGQAVGSGDGYPPIRLTAPLPTVPVCAGGACGAAR